MENKDALVTEELPNYEDYAFPDKVMKKIPELNRYTTSQLLEMLQSLSGTYEGLLRMKHCLLNLALAERGVAPSFRDVVNGVNRRSGLTAEQRNESNDRQIHDLYWLHRHYRNRLTPSRGMAKNIFAGDKFDFHSATEFVTKRGKVADKIRALSIPPSVQIQLFTLRTQQLGAELKSHKEKARWVARELHNRSMQSGRNIKVSVIPTRMQEYFCLDLACGVPPRAADYWSRMTGEPVTKKFVEMFRTRKKWFADVLPDAPFEGITGDGAEMISVATTREAAGYSKAAVQTD